MATNEELILKYRLFYEGISDAWCYKRFQTAVGLRVFRNSRQA
jgi:hypothetical protein